MPHLASTKTDATMPTVRAVERAIGILETLLVAPQGMRLVELSETLGLHKTTVLRLLRTLGAIHLVRRTADDRYHWDPLRWLAVVRNLATTTTALEFVQSTLQDLVDETGQTAAIWAPDGRGRTVLLVTAVLPRVALRVDVTNHNWAPLHACAAGKLCLAALPEEALDRHLATDLHPYTPHTRVDRDDLRAHLAEIRGQGYATNYEEVMLGAGGLAVPLYDDVGKLVGAVGLAGLVEKYDPPTIARWLPLLFHAAARLSQALYLETEETTVLSPKFPAKGAGEARPQEEGGVAQG